MRSCSIYGIGTLFVLDTGQAQRGVRDAQNGEQNWLFIPTGTTGSHLMDGKHVVYLFMKPLWPELLSVKLETLDAFGRPYLLWLLTNNKEPAANLLDLFAPGWL